METFKQRSAVHQGFLVGTYYAVSADWYTCAVNNQNKRDSEKTFTGVKLSVTPDKEASGDIGGFAALATALAATIGTGNIVGVATAIGIGGPVLYSGCGSQVCWVWQPNMVKQHWQLNTV